MCPASRPWIRVKLRSRPEGAPCAETRRAGAPPAPPHGLRGGRLPEPRGVPGRSGHATLMILGEVCTRACAFCNVKTGLPTGLDRRRAEPAPGRRPWPRRGLQPRGGDLGGPGRPAGRRRRALRALHPGDPPCRAPATTVEVLTPDFRHKPGAVEAVAAARPGRLQPQRRDGAGPLPAHPPRRQLPPTRWTCCERVKQLEPSALHQVRPHGGARRVARRGGRALLDDLRASRTSTSSPSDSTCGPRRAHAAGRPLLDAAGVRRAEGVRGWRRRAS